MKVLIIDTDNYSGNFERELCLFLTGQVGDADVGQGFLTQPSPITYKNWWDENIVQVNDDDDNILTPVKMWETPGWFNNGMGKNYKDIPENEAIAVEESVKSMTSYVEARMLEAQRRLREKDFDDSPIGYTKENCEVVIQSCLNDIKRVSVLTKFPAYQSVAIFVKDEPPEEVWKEFQERSTYFANHLDKILPYATTEKLEIVGFRKILNYIEE